MSFPEKFFRGLSFKIVCSLAGLPFFPNFFVKCMDLREFSLNNKFASKT